MNAPPVQQTLNVRISITAVLQNPPGVYEDATTITVPAQIVDDPKFREAACASVIKAQVQAGALLRKIDEDTVEGIPMCRVLNITAVMDKVSRLGLAL